MTKIEQQKQELENLEQMAKNLANPKSKTVRLLMAAGAHMETMINTINRLVEESRVDYEKQLAKKKTKS